MCAGEGGGLWLVFGGEEIGSGEECTCKLGWLKRRIEKGIGIGFFGIHSIQRSNQTHVEVLCIYHTVAFIGQRSGHGSSHSHKMV